MAFDTQIPDLVGGTIDQVACDQWAADACKEIINQLPEKLKAKCSTISIVNATNGTTLDLDGIGDILNVTRLSADSGGYYLPCREIPAQYGDLANDSTDLNYFATAADPVYYITSNSSDAATLFVKPTTTDAQPANAYHISYPTVAFNSTTIVNFPDEAEYLVVLYAATKACLYQMNTLQTDTTIDTTALGAIATELNKADDIINTAHTKVGTYYTEIATLENADLWDNTNERFDIVKNALGNAQDLINNNQPSATTDAYGALAAEDTEIVTSALQVLQMEINRASAGASEIGLLIQKHSLPLGGVPQLMSTSSGYISQAAGYVAEASARLGADNAKYQWYGDQYAKLSAEYARGLAALKG